MASTYRNLRLDARRDLEQAGLPLAEPESMILLMVASGKSREELVRDNDLYAPENVIETYRDLVRRRKREEPRLLQVPSGVQSQVSVGACHRSSPRSVSRFSIRYHASSPLTSGRTRVRARMATSSVESSGSKVVKFCIHIPGAERMRVTGLSCRPMKRLSS